ncbi:tubulin-tyrosine ligase family protein [Chrysochromulina tobinii]|uniref:Tubulin-tyrosine ligase family protein n=1 Tax=Chrysochromulina tobinii TaxID=1460289 RepID=A0A0M0JFD7_9EUKA|nr:tubulin-tyrosine ligase family protein [Chrysochromulina tobinii]|eukprot:KOO25311.1 tubulin-tyrosine ligase family protein [Chrysochromulina sp. CCMP291]
MYTPFKVVGNIHIDSIGFVYLPPAPNPESWRIDDASMTGVAPPTTGAMAMAMGKAKAMGKGWGAAALATALAVSWVPPKPKKVYTEEELQRLEEERQARLQEEKAAEEERVKEEGLVNQWQASIPPNIQDAFNTFDRDRSGLMDIQALRDALERRGWVEEEDADSTSFGLKWTIKAAKAEQHITDGTVGDEQILNHFERAWELITKHRLSGNLRALPWTEGVDPDTFVPRTYYVHEPAQLKEFVVDYFVTAARAALVDAVASSAWPPAAPERVNAAVSIIRRFLARIQEAAAHARLEEASADHARAAEELRRIPLNGSSSAAAAEPAAAASQTTRAAASTGVAKAVVKKGGAEH